MFTLEYTAIVTMPILVIGYALAVFVRANRPGSTVFRTMIFVPYIVGLVAESFMAVVELQPDSGTVNFVLAHFGIVKASTAWTVHTGLALTAISVLVIWFASGLTMMLLMAGMQGIPVELYESARVDGASWWSAERRITIPLLRRSIALSLIISVVGSFLAFNQFFIITDGGPGTSTQSVVMAIYQTAFADFNVGLASAMSIVLIIVVGLITFLQFRVPARRRGLMAAAVCPRPAGPAPEPDQPQRAGLVPDRGRGHRRGVRGAAALGGVPLLPAGVRGQQPAVRGQLHPPDVRQLPDAAVRPGRHPAQRDQQPDRGRADRDR